MLTRRVIQFNRIQFIRLPLLTSSSIVKAAAASAAARRIGRTPSFTVSSASASLSTAASPSQKKRKADSTNTMSGAASASVDTKSSQVMKAVRIHAHGGPDAMKFETTTKPEIKDPNQVLIRIAAAGVNFIDTYQRKGMYQVTLPHTLGREASGVVEAVGTEVKEFKVGSRVVFFGEFSYAEYAVMPADKLVSVPTGTSLTDACALLLQGLTAHAMMTSTYAVKAGDTVLVQAGAGGTGQILVQVAKIKGAKVITTVGSADKAAIAKSLGADHVINYNTHDFVAEVKTITGGKGCQAVYDGVGASTAMKSLKCCATLGHLILFGNASGKVPPIDPLDLCQAGSITLTRPMLNHYVVTKQALDARSQELFGWVSSGKVKVSIGKTFQLSEAAEAHTYLESRASTGKILLLVDAHTAKL